MPNDSLLPFSFPAIRGKKVTAAFDGGRLSSDGGVMLLREAERRLGIAARLARLFPDERDGTRVIHRVSDMIRARIFAGREARPLQGPHRHQAADALGPRV